MIFNSPISEIKAAQLIELIELAPDSKALDVGCGTGEFLTRLIKSKSCSGLGIDSNSDSITTAHANAKTKIPKSSFEFRKGEIENQQLEDASFDLAMCIGSTHAYGMGDVAYPNALNALSRLVKPGGQILIGEGYWKQTPDQDYLKAIGDPVGVYHSHEENIKFAESLGLISAYATVSSDDEWNYFEWSHRLKAVRNAMQNPNDPSSTKRLERTRGWLDGYLRWGHNTMGFGFYLFIKPGN